MNKMFILYGLAIIAVVGILICSFSSVNGTALTDTSSQSTYTAKSQQGFRKKSCPCCDEKQKHMHRMMRQWLNEKP